MWCLHIMSCMSTALGFLLAFDGKPKTALGGEIPNSNSFVDRLITPEVRFNFSNHIWDSHTCEK